MTQSQCKFIGLIYQTLPHQLKVFKFKEEGDFSTNGPWCIGGSINIQQCGFENSFEVNNTLGSYNTIKNSVGFSTGFINNFELSEESLGLNQMVILIDQVPTFAHTFYKGFIEMKILYSIIKFCWS